MHRYTKGIFYNNWYYYIRHWSISKAYMCTVCFLKQWETVASTAATFVTNLSWMFSFSSFAVHVTAWSQESWGGAFLQQWWKSLVYSGITCVFQNSPPPLSTPVYRCKAWDETGNGYLQGNNLLPQNTQRVPQWTLSLKTGLVVYLFKVVAGSY